MLHFGEPTSGHPTSLWSIRTVSFITLYDSNGNKEYVIKLDGLVAQFEYPAAMAGVDIVKGQEYIIDSTMNWSFTVTNSGLDVVCFGNFYDSSDVYSYVKVRLRKYALQVWMCDCFYNGTCGLWGFWDSDNSNDLEGYSDIQSFGESYCNQEIVVLSSISGDDLFNDSFTESRFVIENDCETTAINYRAQLWNVSCSDCDGSSSYSYCDVQDVRYIFVTLHESSQNEIYLIQLGSSLSATFVDNNGTAATAVDKNVEYIIHAPEDWYFIVSDNGDGHDVVLTGDFDAKIKYRYEFLQLWVSSCSKGELSKCGL